MAPPPAPLPADDSLSPALEEAALGAFEAEGVEPALARLCREHPGQAAALRRLAAALDARTSRSDPDPLADLLGGERSIGPYRVLEELGRGGFGTVYIAERRDPVYQKVALKVINPGMDTREVLARFEVERHALSLMNHPGIARVLDAGQTRRGRPYFVMELVTGFPIHQYCERRKLPVRTRLELMIQVCDAVQHAHQKGIIHRDLSARNILVTEVDGKPVAKIIDFGVAKSLVHRLTDKTLHTQQSEVFGTPEYMSPEQALSAGQDIDTRTDVFALGVVLYQLLTGTLPIPSERLRSVGRAEREEIIRTTEPPLPSVRLASVLEARAPRPGKSGTKGGTAATTTTTTATVPDLRGDLDWITMKAMAKDRDQRYAGVGALAEDLRHHLANEVVVAGPLSARYRIGKFVRRYRLQVGAAAGVVLSLVVGLAVALWFYRQAREAGTVAEGAERRATESLANYQRLRDRIVLDDLQRRADQELWPAVPERKAAMQLWLDEADALIGHTAEHRALLQQVRSRATSGPPFRFADTADQFLHDTLAALVSDLEAMVASEQGMVVQVRARMASVARLQETIAGDKASVMWRRANEMIAASEQYPGLSLRPQFGLRLWGRDPDPEGGGLILFTQVDSGAQERVAIDPDDPGHLLLMPDSPIFFVLIPGGDFCMGAQAEDPGRPGYDPMATPAEKPLDRRIRVEPFFLSKFELTQQQWMTLSGRSNPSEVHANNTLLHPVQLVSWEEADLALRHHGLVLPTEAQWEYACRAGTTTPWYTGATKESLLGTPVAANLADKSALARSPWPDAQEWPEYDDKAPLTAPVGLYRPNRFGLYDMLGNVDEWCRDRYARYGQEPTGNDRAVRGGSFRRSYRYARVSARNACAATDRLNNVGIRPAREIER